jgi:hypothetical protein
MDSVFISTDNTEDCYVSVDTERHGNGVDRTIQRVRFARFLYLVQLGMNVEAKELALKWWIFPSQSLLNMNIQILNMNGKTAAPSAAVFTSLQLLELLATIYSVPLVFRGGWRVF